MLVLTKNETIRLLDTLLGWYPNAKGLQGDKPAIIQRWHSVLSPYPAAAVMEKALEWNRGEKGRFLPDPRDLIPETLPYTASEIEQAYRQALWAQAGHTGLWRPGDEL